MDHSCSVCGLVDYVNALNSPTWSFVTICFPIYIRHDIVAKYTYNESDHLVYK